MKTCEVLMNLRRIKKWLNKAIEAEQDKMFEVEIENIYRAAKYKFYKNDTNDIILEAFYTDGEPICVVNVTYGVVLENKSREYVDYLEVLSVNLPYVLLEKLA